MLRAGERHGRGATMPTHQCKPHAPRWRTTRSRSDYAHAPVEAPFSALADDTVKE